MVYDGTAGMDGDAREEADHRAQRRSQELNEIALDVEARLKKVCAHLPEEEFRQLVLDIARNKQRHQGRDPTRPRGADSTGRAR